MSQSKDRAENITSWLEVTNSTSFIARNSDPGMSYTCEDEGEKPVKVIIVNSPQSLFQAKMVWRNLGRSPSDGLFFKYSHYNHRGSVE